MKELNRALVEKTKMEENLIMILKNLHLELIVHKYQKN